MTRDAKAEDHYAPPVPNAPWKSAQGLCRIITSVAFDLKVYGAKHVPRSGGVLLVSNHQSFLDPILVGVRIERPISYMARHGLFEITPAFSWMIRKLGAFPVRQEGSAAGAVKMAIARLREGHAINMFPEGSRTSDGEIQKIEGGAALIIRGAKVPVVPVAIHGSFEAWPRGARMPHPHPIRVKYGPPADLSAMRPAEIVKWIDETLHFMLEDLRKT